MLCSLFQCQFTVCVTTFLPFKVQFQKFQIVWKRRKLMIKLFLCNIVTLLLNRNSIHTWYYVTLNSGEVSFRYFPFKPFTVVSNEFRCNNEPTSWEYSTVTKTFSKLICIISAVLSIELYRPHISNQLSHQKVSNHRCAIHFETKPHKTLYSCKTIHLRRHF